MKSRYHLVRFSGAFAFIKPWTAVRDNYTASQQFLTPSIVTGIEKKLFPELLDRGGHQPRIIRHRLSYSGISRQQERTQSRGMKISRKSKKNSNNEVVSVSREVSIWTRGVLLDPVLWLAFSDPSYAERATAQHICLCRNEDMLFPDGQVIAVDEDSFDTPWREGSEHNFDGFELRFGESSESFPVGFDRFNQAAPMHGTLHIVGKVG